MASRRSAPINVESCSVKVVADTPLRLAPVRSELRKAAPFKVLPLMLTPRIVAPKVWTALRFSAVRSQPVKSTLPSIGALQLTARASQYAPPIQCRSAPSVSVGVSVSVTTLSCREACRKPAPFRFAPVRTAFCRRDVSRSVLSKFVPVSTAWLRSVSLSFAPCKSAPVNTLPRRSAPRRSALASAAPRKSVRPGSGPSNAQPCHYIPGNGAKSHQGFSTQNGLPATDQFTTLHVRPASSRSTSSTLGRA